MKITKGFSLVATIVLFFILCSCSKGGNDLKIETSPSEKNLIHLASTIYDESQLLEIVNFKGLMNELQAKHPIECLREDSGTYRASYLGDGSIAVILFDDSGNKLWGKIYNTQLLKSDFGRLSKGQQLDEVRAIDPNGEYLFLHTGRNDTPKVSSHYTKDGYLITIEYDALNTIISIDEELI